MGWVIPPLARANRSLFGRWRHSWRTQVHQEPVDVIAERGFDLIDLVLQLLGCEEGAGTNCLLLVVLQLLQEVNELRDALCDDLAALSLNVVLLLDRCGHPLLDGVNRLKGLAHELDAPFRCVVCGREALHTLPQLGAETGGLHKLLLWPRLGALWRWMWV